jgi:hypothetical protein
MDEVAQASTTAHLVGKNPNFVSEKKNLTFMGMPVGRPTAA